MIFLTRGQRPPRYGSCQGGSRRFAAARLTDYGKVPAGGVARFSSVFSAAEEIGLDVVAEGFGGLVGPAGEASVGVGLDVAVRIEMVFLENLVSGDVLAVLGVSCQMCHARPAWRS